MKVLELPVELLTQIFRQLVCVELRRTLTTSQLWCATAKTVCYEDITLDFTTCEMSIDAQCKGLQRIPITALRSLRVLLPPSIADQGAAVVISALEAISAVVKEAKTLIDFTLQSTLLPEQYRSEPHFALWTSRDLARCVNVLLLILSDHKALQSVNIDIVRPCLHGGLGGPTMEVHLCPAIGRILARVPCTWLRFPNLCEAIFEHAGTEEIPRRAHDIIINLRHFVSTPGIMATASSYDCADGNTVQARTSSLLIPSRIREAARKILPALPRLDCLRVIWHEYPSLDVYAEDVVSGRVAKIQGDNLKEWGEEVEEICEESDIESISNDGSESSNGAS